LPAPLAEAFEAVRAIVGAPFNRVGLNLYRDGHDSVALHSDKTDKLLPGQPIAIVSLGASRRMSIRPKAAASHTGSYGAGHKPSYSATRTAEHTAEHTAERNAGGVAGHNASAASRILHVELEPGSCLVMSYASQFTHEHGIPKLASASGPRISLAFRCFNEQG
jgi:alkylated DNA repair dioxygenase AlkB